MTRDQVETLASSMVTAWKDIAHFDALIATGRLARPALDQVKHKRENAETVLKHGCIELAINVLVDAGRLVDAFESFADSLAKLANPPVILQPDGELKQPPESGWPVRVKPVNPPGCG